MRNLIAILLASWVVLGLVTTTRAADDAQQPGVLLRFFEGNEGGTGAVTRVSRLIAIDVPKGAAVASRYRSSFGPTRSRNIATFTGNLNLRLRSYVKFHAEGNGRLTLELNGVKVLEAAGDDLSRSVSAEVRLNKGKNSLVARYSLSSDKDSALRLFWESKSFASEPVPASLLTHDPSADVLTQELQAVEGQSLVAQLRCLKCHQMQSSDAALGAPPKQAPQPEFVRDAPDLTDIGSRLQVDWLATWISDPQKLRAGAHMPVTLHGADSVKTASDIAAYLMSLGRPAEALKNPGDASAGGRLFANLECIVCHTLPSSDEDTSRIPLKDVAAKFQPVGLQQYLLDPARNYAWNPMPRFMLTEAEAANLAAYLSTGANALPKTNAGDATRGKAAFTATGCVKCHPFPGSAGQGQAIIVKSGLGDVGCLAEKPDGKAPHFSLTPDQRSAIKSVFRGSSFAVRCDAELAEAAIHELRCTACHSRDASESLLSQSLAEASQALHQQYPNPAAEAGELVAAEQRIPSLTYAGEKLRPEWMEQFIGGKLNYKPRYFLRARMPAFGAWAATLATGMAEQHGVSPSLPELPQPKGDLVEAGRALCGKTANVGFSCNQCHSIGNVAPFAPFEAPSINFQYVAERIRSDYYSRWMHDPARIDVTTKMPKFADVDDKTGLAAFDHNASRQFDAIWQYLLTGRKIQPPQ